VARDQLDTADNDLAKEDLIAVVSKMQCFFAREQADAFMSLGGISRSRCTATHKVSPPRPPTATSIPNLLQLFQNEWDAQILETFQLKKHLDTVRAQHNTRKSASSLDRFVHRHAKSLRMRFTNTMRPVA
jgi:hypothetical protein